MTFASPFEIPYNSPMVERLVLGNPTERLPSREVIGNVPIVHIAGSIAAGKETASEIFERDYGFSHFVFSDVLKDEVKRRGKTEPFLRDDLRATFLELLGDPAKGPEYFCNAALEAVIESHKNGRFYGAVIEGSRDARVSAAILKQPLAVGIWIDADTDTRFERFKARGATDEQINEFQIIDELENQQMTPIRGMSDFTIDNNSDLSFVRSQIHEIMLIRYGLPPIDYRSRTLYHGAE